MKSYFCIALLVTLCTLSNSLLVTFDGRSFSLDGRRTLFVAGSVHYPRAARNEWPKILQQAKDNGINLIQTYVFWDIHEPENGIWNFPSSPTSNEDLVAFVEEAGKLGLYVNLRISGYVCAEWNLGGLPAWLLETNSTWRTYDTTWMKELGEFMDKTVSVVKTAGLLAVDGGPIIMMQMENEYGNMESFYGANGHKYVQWAAQYALNMNLGIPWIMCQQGEGVGTAPPASVINTCNGFYCDNWISKHTKDFPNQPHMWTENWPGWFQNWGQPIPHRPSVDIAFAVARWFARGGSYMNYYMAFGGSNFGRTVGGPLIVTSYDYDVQVNEYAMRAEPKFSLLRELHRVLQAAAPVLLSQAVPQVVPLTSTCESHTYSPIEDFGTTSVQFLSNWGEVDSCVWTVHGESVTVPAWSVTIVSGGDLFNTKTNAFALPANKQVGTSLGVKFSEFDSWAEPVPGHAAFSAGARAVTAPWPLEQLSLTKDSTDYLWYSTLLSNSSSQQVELSFTAGGAGGGVLLVFADGEMVASSLGTAGGPPLAITSSSPSSASSLHSSSKVTTDLPMKLSFHLPVSSTANADVKLDILSVSMGLQNYGPYLELMKAGIISNITMKNDLGVSSALGPFQHTVGLTGEQLQLPLLSSSAATAARPLPASSSAACGKLCWYQGSFFTPASLSDTAAVALDLARSMGKGAVWVNGHMLGRYWNITATATTAQRACDQGECSSHSYVGSYGGDKCRTGCGGASQRYYKLPAQWLLPANSAVPNTILLFEELGGDPTGIDLVQISMEEI